MKRLFILSALALVISTAPAFADHHGEGKGHNHGGKFEKYDADGNGSISKAEFMAAQEEKFAKIDTDGNGEISREEMKAKKEKMREKMKEKRMERKEKMKDSTEPSGDE